MVWPPGDRGSPPITAEGPHRFDAPVAPEVSETPVDQRVDPPARGNVASPAAPHQPSAPPPSGSPRAPRAFSVEEFEDRLAAIHQRLDPPYSFELAADEARDFRSLNRTEREMLRRTLDLVETYQLSDTMTRADYMMSTLRTAAELSRDDDGVAQPRTYVDLVHLAMNTLDLSDNAEHAPSPRRLWAHTREAMRPVLGAGHRPAGSAVEVAYGRVVHDRGEGAESFNPNVVERAAPRQSLTHHYAEFLRGAYRRPDLLLQEAQEVIDDPMRSEGDYRSGSFAIMIGGGLERGEITVEQAVALTEWAYRGDSDPPPPWGTEDLGAPSFNDLVHVPNLMPGAYVPPQIPRGWFVTPGEYRLDDWLAAYEAAHPAASTRPFATGLPRAARTPE